MAKDKITDYDTTPDNNTDIGGTNIQGTAAPSNFDDALRTLMAQLAKVNAGTDPVADTWTFGDLADLTRRMRFNTEFVTSGQTRVITVANRDIDMAKLVSGEYAMSLSDAEKKQGRLNIGAGAPDIILQDQKSAGTDGGSNTGGSTITRTLNTEVRDVNGDCSLSSNRFTLTAGTYYVEATAPVFAVNRNRLFIYNVTDAAVVLIGESNFTDNVNAVQNRATVKGVFTVAASKALDLRHYTQTTVTNGFGEDVNDSFTEVYAVVHLWRIA